MPMEIWGLCQGCRRWFYCDGWFDRTVEQPTCPVCGAEPTAIVNRAAEQVPELELADVPVGASR